MIRFHCPACRKGLSVADGMAGRAAQCPGCKGKVRIPMPVVEVEEAELDEAIAIPKRAPSVVASKRRPVEENVEDDEEEIERPRRAKRRRADEDDEDDTQFAAEPKRRKKKRNRARTAVGGVDPFYLGLIGIAVVCLLSTALGLIWPAISAVAILLGMMLVVVGGIWIVVIAFGESSTDGILCLLIPFYSLYFVLAHFPETKKAFFAYLVGVFFVIANSCAGAIAEARIDAGVDNRDNGNPIGKALDQGKGLGRLVVVANDRIYFTTDVLEVEARNLAREIRRVRFFDGPAGVTMQLSKQGEIYVVSLAMADGQWENPAVLESTRQLAEELSATAFAGRPVEVWLCDTKLRVRAVVQ